MLKKGILNPQLNDLLARVRHNNTLVIADRGYTYFPDVEIIDLSLIDDIPTVLQVFEAIKPNFDICKVTMAEEFKLENTEAVQQAFFSAFGKIPLTFKPSDDIKKSVPKAIGIIRTGDTIQYANMMLESGRVTEQ